MPPYAELTAVAEPKPYHGLPDDYTPHHWMSAPAGRPGVATMVLTEDGMAYCTGCRRWFRFMHDQWGKYPVGTDGELAVSCTRSDWHGHECNCFGHPQPGYRHQVTT